MQGQPEQNRLELAHAGPRLGYEAAAEVVPSRRLSDGVRRNHVTLPTVLRDRLSEKHTPQPEDLMTRPSVVFGSAALSAVFLFPPAQQGADLARRIAGASDGLVKMTYAPRDGICGDGRSFIADATRQANGYHMWF